MLRALIYNYFQREVCTVARINHVILLRFKCDVMKDFSHEFMEILKRRLKA